VGQAEVTPTAAPHRVAVITVHGVADQRPGQTVRELARLLCHGGAGLPRYVEGELHDVIVPVGRLPSLAGAGSQRGAAAPDKTAATADLSARVTPGRPSDFYLAQRQPSPDAAPLRDDLGLALSDHLLARYQPAERDALYESTRIGLQRKGGAHSAATPVDLYELYWADYSRLQPGGIRALSASYQLFFHLSTLARDVVDQIVLAAGRHGGVALRSLQRLHAWSAWLLKGPAALLQLAMLLLVIFGALAFVPPSQHAFLLGFGGALAALVLTVMGLLAAQRQHAPGAGLRAALPWVVAAAICAAIAIAAASTVGPGTLYFGTAVLAVLALGAVILRRYGETVRGVGWVGAAALLALAGLLLWHAIQTYGHATTVYDWMLTAALATGEYLLAALLVAWALLVIVQTAALSIGFALARHAQPEVAATLATARIGMVVSTALFAILSLVLWSIIATVSGLALKDLLYAPEILGNGYRSGAIFFEAQVEDVGTLFTPLMALIGVIGALVLVALAPSVREELTPGADAQSAAWSARLGRWWTRARHGLGVLFGTAIPWLAVMGGAVYLLFVARKLFGVDGALAWLGDVRGDVLVNVGKWLAGGAVTITALGARFTQTFGKLRVALDAVLDVDNYFRDPANRRPPRARIFSRYAALLDYLRARGYTRLIIVAHSQGTVISADLLRYLHRTGRLAALTGAMPVTLVTVGSPLRDLYAARFPLQYGWMGAPPETFARAEPAPDALGLNEWINAYRSGDYVGRAIWTPAADAAAFRVAAIADDGAVAAHRAEGRTEFCIGAGAHTHYFADDAVTLAAEIDRLIGAP
jgi:hypothetical protein